MRKQTKKQRQAVIDAIIQRTVSGWSIPMMKIQEVYRAGEDAAKSSDAAIPGHLLDQLAGQKCRPIDEAISAAVLAVLERVAVKTTDNMRAKGWTATPVDRAAAIEAAELEEFNREIPGEGFPAI
jgi:hypothetical protein